jgi:energy-converting hydrogenase Eha subunit A
MAAEKAEAPSNAIGEAAPDPGPVSITAPALPAGKLSSAANSVRLLMIVLAASLALAGIIAAAVLKLANIQRTRRRRPANWEVPFNADRPPLRIEAETPALELGAEAWSLQPTFIEPAPAPQMLPRWLQHGRR